MTTFTSRQFNQNASGAKRAASAGPVFITDRGRPAHVLMTIDQYRRLSKTGSTVRTLADACAMDGDLVEDFDDVLDQVRADLRAETPRPVDLD